MTVYQIEIDGEPLYVSADVYDEMGDVEIYDVVDEDGEPVTVLSMMREGIRSEVEHATLIAHQNRFYSK